jgi:hypothetical protein
VGLERSIDARLDGTLDGHTVVDVQFVDFMADQIGTVARVYDEIGLELTAEAEARMRTFLEEHPGDGGGTGSRYRFSDTGLDAEEQRERSRRYQEHFAVASEPVV